MSLRWHTEAEPCLLAGVPVTPRKWTGGVVELLQPKYKTPMGRWAWITGNAGIGERRNNKRPIFPPRGWAGQDDWTLFNAAIPGKDWDRSLFKSDDWEVLIDVKGQISVRCGVIERGQEYHDCTVDYREVSDPAALILALQNAQVLAQRLADPRPADTAQPAQEARDAS